MNTKKLLILLPLLAVLMLVLVTVSASADGGPKLTKQEQLGKSIFFDQNLSLKRNQACAACHTPSVGWTGADSNLNSGGGVYEGSVAGRFGARKPPSAGYATLSPIFHLEGQGPDALFVGGNFWDGRATGEKLGNPAADQAQGPFLNPVEQAMPDSACVVYRICNPTNPRDYPVSFSKVWGDDACRINWPANVKQVCSQEGGKVTLSTRDQAKATTAYNKIALSIAAYEASPEVNAFSSKFDLYLQGKAKLSKQEQKGYELFTGKALCANCHVITLSHKGRVDETIDAAAADADATDKGKKSTPPLFTDFTFDNIGVPKNPANPVYTSNPGFVDQGLGGYLATRSDYASYAAENMGKHKVATVRNVALQPNPSVVKAYTHNGYFKTLKGLVHFYNTRDILPRCPGDYTEAQALAANCWPAPEVTANLNTTEVGNLQLKPSEEKAVVAFLKTLSDGYDIWGRSADVNTADQEEDEDEDEPDKTSNSIYLPIVSN